MKVDFEHKAVKFTKVQCYKYSYEILSNFSVSLFSTAGSSDFPTASGEIDGRVRIPGFSPQAPVLTPPSIHEDVFKDLPRYEDVINTDRRTLSESSDRRTLPESTRAGERPSGVDNEAFLGEDLLQQEQQQEQQQQQQQHQQQQHQQQQQTTNFADVSRSSERVGESYREPTSARTVAVVIVEDDDLAPPPLENVPPPAASPPPYCA